MNTIRHFLSRARYSDLAENSIMQTITIAVSAILIAAGLVTAPGLINNARDNNATNDLASIAYAQETQLGETGKYAADETTLKALPTIKLTLSGHVNSDILTCSDGSAYLSKASSTSGKTFYRSSLSTTTSDNISDIKVPGCLSSGDLATFTAPASTGSTGSGNDATALAACTATAPNPSTNAVVAGFLSTASTMTVCDNTSGDLQFENSSFTDGSSNYWNSQNLAGTNSASTIPAAGNISVVFKIRAVGSASTPNWSADLVQLSDGQGGLVAMACDTTLPADNTGTGVFTATCTTTLPVAAAQDVNYFANWQFTVNGTPDLSSTGGNDFDISVAQGSTGGGTYVPPTAANNYGDGSAQCFIFGDTYTAAYDDGYIAGEAGGQDGAITVPAQWSACSGNYTAGFIAGGSGAAYESEIGDWASGPLCVKFDPTNGPTTAEDVGFQSATDDWTSNGQTGAGYNQTPDYSKAAVSFPSACDSDYITGYNTAWNADVNGG